MINFVFVAAVVVVAVVVAVFVVVVVVVVAVFVVVAVEFVLSFSGIEKKTDLWFIKVRERFSNLLRGKYLGKFSFS